MGPGEQIAGLAAMDAADQGFLIVQPAQEQQFFAERQERFEDFAKLHLRPFALGPPLLAVVAVAGEKAGEAQPAARKSRFGLSSPQTGATRATATPWSRRAPRRKARRDSGWVVFVTVGFS